MKSANTTDFSFEKLEDPASAYLMKMVSFEGPTTRELHLEGVEDLSDGQIPEDGATVMAIIEYVLQHQDAAQLPPILEIADIFAAYDDPFDEILELRKKHQ